MIRMKLLPIALVFLAFAGSAARAETLNVVGTGDGLDLFKIIGKLYQDSNPDVQIGVPPSIGSGGAIAAVGAGRERIGRIARPLTPVEVGSGLVAVPVFDIPSVFYVHPGVGARSLTGAQLRAIFEGRITNWSAVGGPDLRIRVVRREENDSVFMVLRASIPEFTSVEVTERSKLALTTQDAISSVKENEGAIGFAPYSSAVAEQLAVISLNGIAPTSPKYPAKVRVSLLRRETPPDPAVNAFIRFMGSAEARRAIIASGALPLDK